MINHHLRITSGIMDECIDFTIVSVISFGAEKILSFSISVFFLIEK